MKEPVERTKVVIRHLPPSLTHPDLFQQIDHRFAGRYHWFSFRPGKNSQKHQIHSRAYIDFITAEDVLEFSDFFGGHVFVNEKGTQYKAMVEYAPSQRVPRSFTKKDGREGTIYKDPGYLEFLKLIAKPVENLPSAEIQLERKEADQTGTTKETVIVTPLMEFVRNKRVETGIQGSSLSGKVRRAWATSPKKPGSGVTKRGSEKKYVVKDSVRMTSRKGRSTFTLLPRQEDQLATSSVVDISGLETVCGFEGSVSGIPVTAGSGKKKILLLKGKERDKSHMAEGTFQTQSGTFAGNSLASATPKENQRSESGGRLFRSILINETLHGQPSTASQPHPKIQILNSDSGKRPHRSINPWSGFNDYISHSETNASGAQGDTNRELDAKLTKHNMHGSVNVREKHEKRTRNKDRPDRGVWAPRSRSSVSHSSDEHFPSSLSHYFPMLSEPTEVLHGERKDHMSYTNKREEVLTAGRYSSSVENGSIRHFGRRGGGVVHMIKDDTTPTVNEGKASKRGGATGHGGHEKQVWVQKFSSGP